jgi:hypothetical protein
MKQNKFRVWDDSSKTMLVDIPHSSRYPFSVTPNGTVYLPNGKTNNSLILMQFTGLYDKNHKEIWESDIVKYVNNNGDDITGIVEWCVDEACFFLNSFPLWEQVEKEVIGNIYENQSNKIIGDTNKS